jgi:hypothetical protein
LFNEKAVKWVLLGAATGIIPPDAEVGPTTANFVGRPSAGGVFLRQFPDAPGSLGHKMATFLFLRRSDLDFL